MNDFPQSDLPLQQQKLSEVDSTKLNPCVRFAKFENGRLKYLHAHTRELHYIAISHVWGADTQWCAVKCLDVPVQASARKVEFINERLPKLVGNLPFWMDILTINQSDNEEKIATIKAIPAVFRDAEKTIAVKENDGIYDCCAHLAQTLETGSAMNQLQEHLAEKHTDYVCEESYIQRLWTLQEIMLSTTVQFVPLNDRPPRICQREHIDHHRSRAAAQRIAWALGYLDIVFRDSVIPAAEVLTKAYLSNGTATWPRRRPSKQEDIFSGHFVTMFRDSLRATTKVRDYFLATMTRFDWYSVPNGAGKMEFNDLFLDLYKQAWCAGHGFGPKITASMTTAKDLSGDPNKAWGPSPDQPIPTCLGDFLKLLGWKQTVREYHFVTDAVVSRVCTNNSRPINGILGLIEDSMKVAETAWNGGRSSGEFDKHGSSPEDWVEADEDVKVEERNDTSRKVTERCMRLLSFMFGIFKDTSCSPAQEVNGLLKRPITREEQETLSMMAAIVTCSIPLSAAEWAENHFVPVHVRIYNFSFLALLSRHHLRAKGSTSIVNSDTPTRMHVFGRNLIFGKVYENDPGRDLVLVSPGSEVPAGILPELNDPGIRVKEGERRIKVLYQDGLTVYQPIEGSETRRTRHDSLESAATFNIDHSLLQWYKSTQTMQGES